jgi:alpha-L-fucosidase
MGPKRDLIGELADAVGQAGMVFGVSSHRAEHWWFMNGGMEFDSDVQDPRYANFYGPAMPTKSSKSLFSEAWQSKDWQPRPSGEFLDDWLARTCELIDKYQPQIIYFDWWIEQVVFAPYLQKMAAYFYNRGLEWQKGVVINHKHASFPEGTAVFDVERGQLEDIRPLFWQTDTAMAKNSWGYVENQDYKTATSIIHDLIDIVSKNGTLLLNVGPRADGTIPEPEQKILLEIGRWLVVNGEAIYDTRPWQVYGEGPTEVLEGSFTDTKRATFTARDFRFTTNRNALYAICLDWPGKEAVIKSLGTGSTVPADMIANISMLGAAETLSWSQSEAGLTIKTPLDKPCQHAYAFKIVLKSP